MTKKCICQICSCGRHRCPHNTNNVSRVINKTKLDNCEVTEYGGKFKDFEVTRGPFSKPVDRIVSEGDYDHNTVHKSYFVPHTADVKHYKRVEEYTPSTEPMELHSEYQKKFMGEHSQAAKMPPYLKRVTQRIPSGKVSGETIHNTNFQAWNVGGQSKVKRKETYVPPSEPFKDTSIHRSDFIDFKQKPLPIAHQPNMLTLEGNMSLETSNRSDFKRHNYVPEFIKRKASYKPVDEPFSGNSFLREDFPNHGSLERTKIFKPVSTVLKSQSPMQCETTHVREYQNWKPDKKFERQKDAYRPPSGKLDLKTTSSDYCQFGPGVKAAKSARPKTKLRTGRDGDFDGLSNYADTFKPWSIQRTKPFRALEELRRSAPAALKFTDTSEHREMFKEHKVSPANITKRQSTLFQTSDKLDDISRYKQDFKGEIIKDCPSHSLLKLGELSGVKFEEDFHSGHKFVIANSSHDKALPPIPSGGNGISQPEMQLVTA